MVSTPVCYGFILMSRKVKFSALFKTAVYCLRSFVVVISNDPVSITRGLQQLQESGGERGEVLAKIWVDVFRWCLGISIQTEICHPIPDLRLTPGVTMETRRVKIGTRDLSSRTWLSSTPFRA